MGTQRITRRHALAAGFVGAATLASCGRPRHGAPEIVIGPTPVGEQPSWVGQSVLLRRFESSGEFLLPKGLSKSPDENDPVSIRLRLNSASYTIKAERDSQVLVCHENGGPAWVERDDLFLVDEALAFFSAKLVESPTDTFALISRGWAHYLLGETTKAIRDFDEFLRLMPPDAAIGGTGVPLRWEGLVNRGLVLAEARQFDAALRDLDEAVRSPGVAIAWVNRGYANELRGLYYAAIADYRQAHAIAPSLSLANNNAAWLLSTCPEDGIRDADSALKTAKALCETTQNLEGMYLDTLAACFASTWQFDDAVKTEVKALEDKSFIARYGDEARKRLQLYKDKKPYRMEVVKK